MGLFFNSSTNKSISGGRSFDRFKQIGGIDAKKILEKMRPETKTKVSPYLDKLGASRKSIESIAKIIGKEKGYETKKKFLKAAEQHFSPSGLTAEQVKRNLKFNIQKDTSAVETIRGGAQKTRLSILGQVGGGVKGTASRLGLNQSATGFAGQANKPKL